jgi:SAM-dependent methyltransferase
MSGHDPSDYGRRFAEIYDTWFAAYDDEAITTLRDLAGGGRALELGIGTGRIAAPLKRQGVDVHGIDASAVMVAKLRGKPGGDSIPVTLGDLADVGVEGQFSLVFVVFNTFFVLLSQDDQVRCFRNVARHLTSDGVFLIEAFVPEMTRYSGRQTMRVISIGDREVRFEATQIDPVSQQVVSQQVTLTEQGAHLYPIRIRYAWPSELDLMAQMAGLRLQERWGGWRRTPVRADSATHISVYGRAT